MEFVVLSRAGSRCSTGCGNWADRRCQSGLHSVLLRLVTTPVVMEAHRVRDRVGALGRHNSHSQVCPLSDRWKICTVGGHVSVLVEAGESLKC